LIPLSSVFLKAATGTWAHFWAAISAPNVVAAFELSFMASFAAASVNVLFGLLIAWVLVRYRFPGRALADAIVDLPFALPTAVAGIALTALYAPNGWIGRPLGPALKWIGALFHPTPLARWTDAWLDGKIVFTRIGVTIALIFIGLPFVVRTVQPVLQELDLEVEEAASSLGASRFQTFWRVTLPALTPALLTGFALAFARALGEYGSVVFISGNLAGKTEIVPLLIITRLEEYDYTGASAIAVTMLVFSFVILIVVNFLQGWNARRTSAAA
jgi:sulfate transport system permease protein